VSDVAAEIHIAWLVGVAELRARPDVAAVLACSRRFRAMTREAERLSSPRVIAATLRDIYSWKLGEEWAKARGHIRLVMSAAADRRAGRKPN
jgi:hypothetical protein